MRRVKQREEKRESVSLCFIYSVHALDKIITKQRAVGNRILSVASECMVNDKVEVASPT